MSSNRTLDAHEPSPQALRTVFKSYQKYQPNGQNANDGVIDFDGNGIPDGVKLSSQIRSADLDRIFKLFHEEVTSDIGRLGDVPIYNHISLPGLAIIPALLPPSVQKTLLSRLLHRELSNEWHKTNLHMHYNVPYPERAENTHDASSGKSFKGTSFFSYSPRSQLVFLPKDPEIHKPLSISKVMNKSLRWMTLGGQYDWTAKKYPEETPPEFPSDIEALLEELFKEMKPQAAIVNIYSPGDTLSLHRDVSEESSNGLVSVSLGCDCLFVIGLGKDPSDTAVIRLRSGDALMMSGDARFAWHGVPKIISNTCPSYLENWPAEGDEYREWRGWMGNKRINLNVRQMYN